MAGYERTPGDASATSASLSADNTFTGIQTFARTGANVGAGVFVEEDGDNGITSSILQATGEMRFRLTRSAADSNGALHFLINPYTYGMAIEYPGVVECWVGDWSVHKSVPLTANTVGASLWVGDDTDHGGLHMKGRDFGASAPQQYRSTILSETFTHASHGPIHLQGITHTDDVRVVWGGPSRLAGSCGTTSGSKTVTCASIVAAENGCPIWGPGIPANTYVGTVTAGVSFLLSSSPYSQVDVNATGTGTVSINIDPHVSMRFGQIAPAGTGDGIIFGPLTDVYLYKEAANILTTASVFKSGTTIVAAAGAATQVNIGAVGPGSTSGIIFQTGEAGANLYRSATGTLKCDGKFLHVGGVGFWNHAAPAAQPATPVTLADVIAVLQGCGLTA